MTTGGWLMLIVSLTTVWSLAIWCYYKVLTYDEVPPEPVQDFHSA